jgi:hypothetical protein
MITIEDCLALSDLTEEEIDAIAEHEHLPAIIAAELGNYLAHLPGGIHHIRSMEPYASSTTRISSGFIAKPSRFLKSAKSSSGPNPTK